MKKNYYDKFKDLSQEELNKSLCEACKFNDLDEVKYLLTSSELKEHADITNNDNAPLIIACMCGHTKIAEYLLTSPDLKKHADIHADNDSSLNYAIIYKYEKLTRYLLSSPKLKEHANIQANNNTAVKAACRTGNLRFVKYLTTSPKLKKHADPCDEDNTCFIDALSLGHIEVAKYLLTFNNIKNHPNFNFHKEKIFRKALAQLKSSNEDSHFMDAINFLIFDLNIEKNQQIENYLSDGNFTKIEGWFNLRELNESLNNDLPINKKISNTKPKL
jgi:ankyrin repeat protein